MNICLYYNSPATGVSLYRLEMPHAYYYKKYGQEVSFFSVEKIDQLTHEELSIIDIFIVNRTWAAIEPAVEKVAEILRQYGAKIILDMDDYWALEPGHAFYEEYEKKGMTATIIKHLECADAIICSTKYLREAILPYNKNVTILPNIPYELYEQFIPSPTFSDYMRFGYFGAGQHLEDVKTTERSMAELAFDKKLNNKYKLYLAGYHPNNAIGHQYEQIFSCAGHNDNYCRIASTDCYSYMSGYNYVDVSLAPLKNTLFNTYKSELKVIEAAWMGKTIIASDIPIYADNIEHGVDGFLISESRPLDWHKYMKELINKPQLAAKMAIKLQDKIKAKFNIDETTQRRHELYKSVKNDICIKEPAECI